jgi:hypothetical protein
MTIWHTWLGFFGLLCGLIAPTIFRVKVMWSALAGLIGGVALVALWNVAVPARAPCLPNAKGVDILRAYRVTCALEEAEAAEQRSATPAATPAPAPAPAAKQ